MINVDKDDDGDPGGKEEYISFTRYKMVARQEEIGDLSLNILLSWKATSGHAAHSVLTVVIFPSERKAQ